MLYMFEHLFSNVEQIFAAGAMLGDPLVVMAHIWFLRRILMRYSDRVVSNPYMLKVQRHKIENG